MKKIQKITFIFMLILMTVACFVFTASAEDLVYGDYSYVLLEDETVKITDYNGSEADVVIPDEIDGKAVTVIGEGAFVENKEIKSVVIPDSVTSIEKRAFSWCEHLGEVTFGDSLVTIGEGAFTATALFSLELPDTVTEIGDFAFSDIFSLCYADLGENIRYVGKQAFRTCYALDGGIHLYNAEYIGAGAFSGCIGLDAVSVGEKLAYLGRDPFPDMGLCLYYAGSEEQFYQIEFEYITSRIAGGIEYNHVHEFGEYYSDNNATAYCDGSKSAACLNGCEFRDKIRDRGSKFKTLDPVSNITATQTTSSIKLSWNAVEGAQFYRLYVRNAYVWRVLNDTTETTQLYKNLRVGTKYTFAVCAGKIVDGKEVLAPTDSTYETSTTTVAPAKIASAQNASVIKLAWTACPGATGYRIFFKTENGWQTCLRATTKTSHAFTRLQPGSKFTFAVRPYVQTNDTIVWCPYTTYTASTTLSPVNLKATATGDSQVTLEWDAVNGADAYRIFCSLDGGKTFKVYKNQTARSIVINNLYVGRPYTFAVRAATITSSGFVWDSSYTPRTITLKSYTQPVLQSMKNGNFQIGIGANDALAVKNGVVVIKGTNPEAGVYRVISNKNVSDSWYMIYDSYKAYTVLTSEQSGLEEGYADAFLDYLKTINPNTGFTVSRITVGGKPYIVESRSDKYGTEYYTYDSNGKLVLIREVTKSGVTYNTNVSYFTTDVPNSMITLPSNYERFYVS